MVKIIVKIRKILIPCKKRKVAEITLPLFTMLSSGKLLDDLSSGTYPTKNTPLGNPVKECTQSAL